MFTRIAEQYVVHNHENKVIGFTFGSNKEQVIFSFGLVNVFVLRSNHISGVVRNCLIVDGRIGERGKLGAIALLVIILAHDEAN